MKVKKEAESLYRISRITGEFLNPETEKIFMGVTWPGISKRLIIALLLCSLNFLASNNIPSPGEFPEYRTIIVPITKAFAVFLIVMAVVIWRSKRYAPWLRGVVSLCEIFIGLQSAANHYFFLTYINKFYDIGTSFIVFYILIFYIVVPNRLMIIFVTNVFISISFAFITNLSGLTSFADIFTISMYFAIANALGYGITLANNRARRQEYHQRIQLKEAQIEAMEAKSMAEEANAAKSRFLAVMNHEMRTPLNVVLGGIQILDSSGLPPKQQDTVSMIRNAGELLKGLIRNILDFTDMERNKLKIMEERFTLLPVLKELERIYTPIARESGLRLILENNYNSEEYLSGDSMRLRQILTNLLNNAVKFTTEGAVTLGVELQERSCNSITLRFEVRDTGIGIREEHFEDILKPFAQVEQTATRNFDGSGLGLAICSELLEAMDSRLEIASKEGLGSSFSFILTLPISSAESVSIEPSVTKAYRILLIDDIEANLKITAGLLNNLKQDVICAEGSRASIDAAESGDFDIVIIDYHMPGKDGIETFREIKELQPDLRAYLMTADTREEVIELGLEAGFSGFIPKPIEISRLREVLLGAGEEHAARLSDVGVPAPEDAVADNNYLMELKQDLGAEVFSDVIDTCMESLENVGRRISEAEDGDDWERLIHQLKGVAGNYRLMLLSRTIAEYERDSRDFDSGRLADAIYTTIEKLREG